MQTDSMKSGGSQARPIFGVAFSAFFIPLLFASCFSSKPIQYFNGVVDPTKLQEYSLPDPVIEQGDLLDIVIYSDNPDATTIFNQAGTNTSAISRPNVESQVGSSGNRGGGSFSYQVDNQGNIRMHAIGKLRAEGLTRRQLESEIVGRLNKLGVLMNPYCAVRYNSYKITVLGEVTRPGMVTLTPERATILEAMSMAGDLTINGRRDKVMIIRETQGKRTQAMVSLADPSIFKSPYFYLKQNDVMIVASDDKKQTPADQMTLQYISLAATFISILSIFLTLLSP